MPARVSVPTQAEQEPSLTSSHPVLTCTEILAILERALHSARSEWLFFRELKLGTGRRNGSFQRLDAFALNTLPHTAMKRVCYEVKLTRADFLVEMRSPLKRRVGMRYSNEFYFVTPAALVAPGEIPAECGLIEVGCASLQEWRGIINRHTGFFHFEPESGCFCVLTVPAPWRDTPGPTWQLTAAMLRNQRREIAETAPLPGPQQQRLALA